jgi:hypothetical protein
MMIAGRLLTELEITSLNPATAPVESSEESDSFPFIPDIESLLETWGRLISN